ncbi:MAG TPA: glycosyltransferase, partial [Pseudonocardiaceae bacterium]
STGCGMGTSRSRDRTVAGADSGTNRREPVLAILHASQPTDAGVAGYVAAVAADQRARGWRVVVACPSSGRLASDLTARGVPRLPWSATRSPSPDTVRETLRLRWLISQVRPDVVHLHSAKAGLAGRLALRGRLPTLFQPHGWSWLAVRGATARATLAWERLACRWTDALVCVGEGEAEVARHERVGQAHIVVRNGVDLASFTPAGEQARTAARDRLGVCQQVPLAVCIGRVTQQKGQDVLLTAWPRVRRGCPEAELVMVGDGALLPTLRRGAPAGVRFVPPATDPRPWYAAADVVVLPSRWEGLSLTLLEAMASGCSVVVSDIPGLAEATTAGVGAQVPVGDTAALAGAIVARLGDPDLRTAEGTAARLAAGAFDVRRTYEQLAAVTAQVSQRR